MKRTLIHALPILLLSTMTFLGCPDKKTEDPDRGTVAEEAAEKGAIEEWTDKTAKEAVDRLQKPIDQARGAKEQSDDRSREMEDALGEL